ncbi:small polypeptide DEVIL 13-like [Quercus robur]|uniref:uncharacterized serine-rich protein C1E8.05-like n=1 Tax=Quercus lobata TaxID=97700 RepID=UPI0012457C9D|nr:uncharacterized serine-rich protein C1E8.05-like [Quercus lobata]XP_050269959.1 small polypeptide DEVIL 13-like [Quercus robur]
MDEKWKLSKKEGATSSHSLTSSKSLFARSSSTKSPSCSSSSKSPFTRSSSTKSTSSKSPLLRSFSQKSSTSKCPLPRSCSQKSSSISSKCSSLAKEQKARFYIMRRCVAMLVCWHKHGDS